MNYDILKKWNLEDPRIIQARKEIIQKETDRVAKIVLDIMTKAPTRIISKDKNVVMEYYFKDKWYNLEELTYMVHSHFSNLKELIEQFKKDYYGDE